MYELPCKRLATHEGRWGPESSSVQQLGIEHLIRCAALLLYFACGRFAKIKAQILLLAGRLHVLRVVG